MLSTVLESDLTELEDQNLDGARRGRRLPHVRSETAITQKINDFCGNLPRSYPDFKQSYMLVLIDACRSLLQPPLDGELEEHVYQHGPTGLRFYWCSKITQACEAHQVIDNGDL